MSEKKISVGRILGAHGVKGQFKVISFTENPQNLALFSPLWIGDMKLTKWTFFGKTGKQDVFIAACDFIKTREDVDRFKNLLVEIDRKQLPNEGEAIYYADFEGREVIDPKGTFLGKVIQVHNFGAGPLLEVQKENEKENVFFSIHTVQDLEQNPLVLTFCPFNL